nr:site-specific integrase [uncultured Flavobacterium sp.]
MKKLKVCFFIKGDKKNKDGETAIYGKIYLGNVYSTFSTSKYILQERWEKTNSLRNALRINNEINLKTYLNSLSDSIEEKYIELIKVEENKNLITPLYLKNFCFNKKTEKKITLLEIIETHNKYFRKQVNKGDRAIGSLEKYERMSNVISDYLKSKLKVKDIEFDKITRKFVFDFDEYLRFDRIHGNNKGLANNTTVKYIRNISVMINHSVKRGLINNNPFLVFDGKLEDIETTFLTLEELRKIEKKVLSNNRLDVVRDIFLFSCYTSYAPIDIKNLRRGNCILDEDLDSWVKTRRKKTGIRTNVLAIPPLKRIIEKYQNNPECINSNRLIPDKSNTNVNAYLKEIADLCNIDKNLTWYVGRHTFATTVALANDIPMEIISQIMGHKRITQTQHYAKLSDKNVKQAMMKLKEKFE